jgi:hypothetical protein
LKPSPQVAPLHTLVQASSLLWLPSSQASPGPTSPSPQTLRAAVGLAGLAGAVVGAVVALLDVGLDEAVAALGVLAGEGAAPASLFWPPWSHCSPDGWSRPSPQTGALQAVGAAVVVVAVAVVAGLAGVDDVVAALLELAGRRSSRRRRMSLPSSHCSPGPWSPSPQTLSSHWALQALPGPFSAPLSHSSVPSPVL